jgi:rhodanese-related sulfurtransferase
MTILNNSSKTKLITSLLLTGAALIISSPRALAHTDVTAEQARELIDSKNNLIIVDVREPSEYCDARGHIPGALNYPWNSGVLQARYEELPINIPILLVCRSGGRSNQAASFLDSKDFSTVYDMLGGMSAWILETTACKYGGGTGEPNDPYLIYTAEQLNTIGLNQEDADKHFKLMADIDLSAYQGDSFNRIGFYDPPEFVPDWHTPFSGVFDGNGHTISNFTYVVDVNEPLEEDGLFGDEDVGLFGFVNGPEAQIKNLGLIDPNIYPAATCTERIAIVGAIVGRLSDGSITNCYVEGGSISGDMTVGGLVGLNSNGTISDCYTTCNVTWAKGRWLRDLDLPFEMNPGSFGGLVGSNHGEIYDCFTTGCIQGNNSSGGLIGHNYRDMFDPNLVCGVISNCYATGDVSGNEQVGGLAGENNGEIHKCHAVGNVSGFKSVGGLVGNIGLDEGIISCSYSISNVSGNERVGGLVGYSNGLTQNSYATGEVLGIDYVGGLIGFNGFGIINHSYTLGSVTGTENVGALLGRNGSGSIYYCYAANTVSGSDNVGGLLGGNISGTVSACFWNIETSGLLDMCGLHFSDDDGCDNEYGKTTAEMQTAGTFLEVGWDFIDETVNGTEDIWWIEEGVDYPHLWWELIDEETD